MSRETRIAEVRSGSETHYTLSLLAASIGNRMGEAKALMVQHVHEGYGSIVHASQRKYGTARDVSIPSLTARHLHALIESPPYQEPDDLVFSGKDRRTQIDQKQIAEAFNAPLARIKISDEEQVRRGLAFYAHRHFFNSLMCGKIADFKLQRLTGHRTEAMVEPLHTPRSLRYG